VADSVFYDGIALSRRKKWNKAASLLNAEMDAHLDSWRYLYTLAICSLHAGNVGAAYDCLRRAVKLRNNEPLLVLGIAAIYLKRGDTKRAADLYLQALELDAKNPLAKKALDALKIYAQGDRLQDFVESGKWQRYIPPPLKLPPGASARRFVKRAKKPALVIVICLAVAGGGYLLFTRVDFSSLFSRIRLPAPIARLLGREDAIDSERPGLAESALSGAEMENPVSLDGSFKYVLTEEQVLSDYRKALRYYAAYRDEAAKVEINRLLNSCASQVIKNKASILLNYTQEPAFTTLKDRFEYREVMKDPTLYNGCYVIWRGMIANIRVVQGQSEFDLLVGYDKRNTLEGIVHTRFSSVVTVNTDTPFEILGKVLVSGEDISLAGVAVHQLR
jgi:tetratricopeptide (TPR) repeat protein